MNSANSISESPLMMKEQCHATKIPDAQKTITMQIKYIKSSTTVRFTLQEKH